MTSSKYDLLEAANAYHSEKGKDDAINNGLDLKEKITTDDRKPEKRTVVHRPELVETP